jgi:hypothetical protein
MGDEMKRWRVEIVYRTDNRIGIMSGFDIEELYELQDIVEDGPHWDTVIEIKIVRLEKSTLTLEEAAKL